MDYKQAVNCGELKLTDDLALFVSMAANAFKEINPNTVLQLEEWGSIYVLPKRLPVFFFLVLQSSIVLAFNNKLQNKLQLQKSGTSLSALHCCTSPCKRKYRL